MTASNEQIKKELIKKSARGLFFHFGLSKTSMDDIARKSGMAKPTLYYYYESKEALFNEIVVEEATLFMERVEKKLPANLPADEKLAIFFRTIYQDLKGYAAEMADVPDFLCEHSPHGRPIVARINELFLEKLRPLLQSGLEEGVFHFGNVEVAATTLVWMTDFLNLDWMRHHPEKQRDRTIEMMIEIILNGLRRRT